MNKNFCVGLMVMTLLLPNFARALDRQSLSDAAPVMTLLLQLQKSFRARLGGPVLRAQDILFPQLADSRPVNSQIQQLFDAVLAQCHTDLATVAGTISEIVEDLENGGVKISQLLREGLAANESVLPIILALYLDENYRGIPTHAPLRGRTVNLLTRVFADETLNRLSSVAANAAMNNMTYHRAVSGVDVGSKVMIGGLIFAAVSGTLNDLAISWAALPGMMGLATFAGGCALMLRGRRFFSRSTPPRLN